MRRSSSCPAPSLPHSWESQRDTASTIQVWISSLNQILGREMWFIHCQRPSMSCSAPLVPLLSLSHPHPELAQFRGRQLRQTGFRFKRGLIFYPAKSSTFSGLAMLLWTFYGKCSVTCNKLFHALILFRHPGHCDETHPGSWLCCCWQPHILQA